MAPGDPRADLREAVRREPRNALAWIVLADAELDAGDALAGQSACQQALALAPGHPEALARLGRAHWLQRRFPEAVASLQAAAGAAPRHPGIAVWLGHALEDAGEAEAAADAYTTAHALAPDEPQLAAYLLAHKLAMRQSTGMAALRSERRMQHYQIERGSPKRVFAGERFQAVMP